MLLNIVLYKLCTAYYILFFKYHVRNGILAYLLLKIVFYILCTAYYILFYCIFGITGIHPFFKYHVRNEILAYMLLKIVLCTAYYIFL